MLWKDLEVADADEMSLEIPESDGHEFTVGYEAPRDPDARPIRHGPAGLPFGLQPARPSMQKSRAKGAKKSEKVEQAAEDAGDGEAEEAAAENPRCADPMPCMLGRDAVQELDAALRLDQIFVEDQRQREPDVTGMEPEQPEVPSSSRASRPARPVERASQYQSHLGVVGVVPVQRASVICAHCGQELLKGSYRLQYAQKKNKPPRSLHPACVLQLPETVVPESVRYLQEAAAASADAQHRAACVQALNLLSPNE